MRPNIDTANKIAAAIARARLAHSRQWLTGEAAIAFIEQEIATALATRDANFNPSVFHAKCQDLRSAQS